MNRTKHHNKLQTIQCCDPLNIECFSIIEHPIFIEYKHIWNPLIQQYVEKPLYTCDKCLHRRMLKAYNNNNIC